MNPIKRKAISQMTGDQLELPLQLIDDIISFYYKYVQIQLTNLNHANINVPNLGTFSIKSKNLSGKLLKYEAAVSKLEKHIEEDKFMSMRKYASVVEMKEAIANMKKANTFIEEEKYEREKKKQERLEYETKSNTNLEDERKNS